MTQITGVIIGGILALQLGVVLAVTAQPVDEIALPSGRKALLHDVITNAPGTEGLAARFRFIADVKQDEDWSEDMMNLCENYALPRVAGMTPMPQQIVISLADRPLPFGEPAPEAVQFFEAFLLEANHCMWEVY